MEIHQTFRRRARRIGAAAVAMATLAGAAACSDDDGELELPPGPTEDTVPDTTPTEDPTGDPDAEPSETVPGATPGPTGDDVAPPDAGGGNPGETPE